MVAGPWESKDWGNSRETHLEIAFKASRLDSAKLTSSGQMTVTAPRPANT